MWSRCRVVAVLFGAALGVAGVAPAPARANEDGASAQPDARLAMLLDVLRTSDSFKARATAAVALGRLGDGRAAPALGDALRGDEHYAVRVAAASALGRLATPAAVPPLLRSLGDQDPYVRDEAQRALQGFHSLELIGAFTEALRSSDATIRWAAVRAHAAVLGRNPAAPLRPAVIAALGDEDQQIRDIAEQAILEMPHEAAVALILDGLSSGGSEIRGACARLAQRHADARAVEPLVGLLVSTDDAEDARTAARSALGAHAGFLDRGALHGAARDVAPERREARVRALRVLGAVDDALAPSLIEQAISDADPIVRVGAGRAAADLPGGRGRKTLVVARERESDARTRKMFELILKNAH